MNPLRVAVVAGGPSAEAEVSRTSARGVRDALVRAGHRPELLELDSTLPLRLSNGAFDLVFPVTHGPLGEDGCLQGLLEVMGLKYVGSEVLASALAANKPAAKVVYRAAGLPVAKDTVVLREDPKNLLRQLRASLAPDLVFKPASGGSAIGVEIIRADMPEAEATQAIERAFAIEPRLLVEQFVPGLELTCGVLEGDQGLQALPPTLIRPKAAAHYDFISKYRSGGSEHLCPAPLASALIQKIQAAALEAHRALGCRDLSRTDFVVDANADGSGRFIILETNTLPGMTPVSLFPEAAAISGIPFESLCDHLVRRAAERPARTAQTALAMP